MIILGISAYYHDSAAAILRDGEIVAAAQEERFTRRKHDAGFPAKALEFCLRQAGISLDKVDYVAFYDKPYLKFERLVQTYLALAPNGFESFRKAIPAWLGEKLFLKSLLIRKLEQYAPDSDWGARLHFSEHHFSHAASAFFPSPFDEAAVLTMDGVGEWATTSLAIGRGRELHLTKEIRFPHSLGLLYAAFTSYTGFKVNSGEYKVMGLAPYGQPKYADLILDKLMDLKPDGSFRLDQSYFNYATGLTMVNPSFHELFGGPPRKAEEKLEERHFDLAASIQAVTEEVVLRLTRAIRVETGIPNLCMAGGVALNCVANGKVLRDGQFDGIWIQPAAGDAGGALGAALAIHHILLRQERAPTGKDRMHGAFLGPEFSQAEIETRLAASGARFSVLKDEALYEKCATALSDGAALGWFQGRMEFGPRALGSRSILGDARSESMQSILNLKIKYRESFRPFAPSVLSDDVREWFELEVDSPYMLLVADVAQKRRYSISAEQMKSAGLEKINFARSEIPAVTHVDYSARVQTVHAETNLRYHALISAFKRKTGCPVIVNTSFNVRGEPIVCTPEDAFRCFMGTEIEFLAVGNCLLSKTDQNPGMAEEYADTFEPD